MKNLILNKNIPILDFKESDLSKKDISAIKKFKSLVINNGDDGLREISKILKEKSFLLCTKYVFYLVVFVEMNFVVMCPSRFSLVTCRHF